jgi:hypothetical protein
VFVVGLLDVENKRGGNRGNRGNITRKQQGHIVVVAVAATAMQARRLDTTRLRNLRAL